MDMMLLSVFLMVLGLYFSTITFFGALTVWGFIENKPWLKRIGVWALLLASFVFALLFKISILIYLISVFFF